MKILITGANGFIGRNLIWELKNRGYNDLLLCDLDTSNEVLDEYCRQCEFVFHLAGINRPQNEKEFMDGNFGFTKALLDLLEKHRNHAPILCTSSIQATLDNPYGKSKLAGEEILLQHHFDTGAEVYIYRLSNVFGKWCRPNYNSVVATFCYNIANDIPIQISDSSRVMDLVYIDDVINTFIQHMEGEDSLQNNGRYYVKTVHSVTLGSLAETIKSFKDSRKTLMPHKMDDEFIRKLYSTYLSYLTEEGFAYPLRMNVDARGSFTEFLKTKEYGQVSINVSKPGVTKGNHWHHTKNEKFLVVSGSGVIRFRKLGKDKIIEYHVSDKQLEVVDVPVGYTHNITNTGTTDLVVIVWANEMFDPERPDTYPQEV